MSKAWQIKKLGDLCNIEIGKTPSRSNKKLWDVEKTTNNIWLSIRDLSNAEDRVISDSREYVSNNAKSSLSLVKKNTLLVSFKLTLGRLAFTGRDLYTNEAIAALNIKDEKQISKEYLYKYLSYFDWNAATKGDVKVKGKTLNKAKLKEIDISYPPLSEQKRIVKILDQAFKKIEKAKENTEKNLQNSKELFESYLNHIFSNPGKDWEEKEIRDVIEKTSNIDPQKNPKDEFLYIDVSSVDKETKEIINISKMIGKNAPSRARKNIKTNDIIFAAVRPTHQRVAIVPRELNDQICSTGYMVLRAKNILNSNFLFYYLLTKSFNNRMESLQKGASYPAVTDNDVKKQIINFPRSFQQQKQIVKKLDQLSEKTKKLESLYKQKLENIEELKKTILSQAFSNKL